MAGIVLEKGKTIYSYGQPMTALHLITNGKVNVSYPGGSYPLGKGDVIGICEICSEIHLLSYVTAEDTTILTYPLTSLDSLNDILQKHPDVARLFLLSCFRQINILLNRSSISELNCSELYRTLTDDIATYNTLCDRYRLPARSLEHFDKLNAFLGDDSPDIWLNGYYMGLSHILASDNYRIMVQEADLSIGMLRKGSLDFRRTYQSLEEQFHYLQQVGSFYFRESGNDLFDFYTSLYYKLGQGNEDSQIVYDRIHRMLSKAGDLSYIDQDLFASRSQSFQSSLDLMGSADSSETADGGDSEILGKLAGSLNTILEYAGPDLDTISSFRQHVHAYKQLSDRSSQDQEVALLRRQLTEEFYLLYSLLFTQTLEQPDIPMPVRMFLYFGYVDEELAGLKNAVTLYRLAETMTDHSTAGVYTFYDWLMAIFRGQKSPSRNEFDQDYSDYIHKQKVGGNITDAELKALENNAMAKVNYELKNMFPQVNKITFGRITTFCPLFCADDVLKDLESSYVTVSRVSQILEEIRLVDYTAFYRESLDMAHLDVMGKETIHLEYLPDIILMPNVGIRGVMWQEIEGKRRNSPGRMVFSIFHMEDLKTTFTHLTGEFRWELCKRVQGNRWNDVSVSSLTSEYFDYIQFYRKNHDLSTEAKEKVKSSLQRAKNSFKEMFVRDYMIWVLFEGAGSPRLNKVARQIMFTYCPFPEDICNTLAQNPLYSELLDRRKIKVAQGLHHLDVLTRKLQNGNIPVPETVEQERYYISGSKKS